MADFGEAYKVVTKNEGGYVNDPKDVGGETYKGIARKIHPNWSGWNIIDTFKANNGGIGFNETLSDPLLENEVRNFYYKMWKAIKGDQIQSQEVANIVFDFYILAAYATQTVQETLRGLGQNISADNAFGNQTLAALNSVNPQSFINRFTDNRIAYHYDRVKRGIVDGKFLDGWIKRAKGFVSGGNTGQMLVGAVLVLGVLWGVSQNSENKRGERVI